MIFIVAIAIAAADADADDDDADDDPDAPTTANDDDYVGAYSFAPTAQFLLLALFVDVHHNNHDLRYHLLRRDC